MTRPAAPLDRAVEEARKALGEYETLCPMGVRTGSRLYGALRAILAALDADRGEAEAALREIAKDYLLTPGVPGCDDLYSCKWCGGDDDHNVGCPTWIARRYFARREEKEVPRG